MAKVTYKSRKEMAQSYGYTSVSQRDRRIRANRAAAGVFDKSDPLWAQIADETDAAQMQVSRDAGVDIDSVREQFTERIARARERVTKSRKQIHAGGDLVTTAIDGGGSRVFLGRLKKFGKRRVMLSIDLSDGRTTDAFRERGIQGQALHNMLIGYGAETDLMSALWEVLEHVNKYRIAFGVVPTYAQIRAL